MIRSNNTTRINRLLKLGFFLLGIVFGAMKPVFSSEIPWKTTEIIPGGRIDAIAYAGNNVVIAGTRNPNPGWIFYSTNNGISWKKGQHLDSSEKRTGITCIACGTNGLCFAINESSEFFKSLDYGKTWTRLCKACVLQNREHFL
jgi:photosystem II stability/assembly factor-like uncharacterized protein